MPNLKISQLNSLTDPAGSDVVPVVNSSVTKRLSLTLFDASISNQRLSSNERIDMKAYNTAYKNSNKNIVRQVTYIVDGIDQNSGGTLLNNFYDYIGFTNPVNTNTFGATIDYVLLETGTYYALEVGTINLGWCPSNTDMTSFLNTVAYDANDINKNPITPGTFTFSLLEDPPNSILSLYLTVNKQPGDYDFQALTFKGLITFI